MYHYTMCGLDNVWLANGYVERDTPYGPGVAIEDADGLDKMIAATVASKPGRLTHKEIRFLRTFLGMSQGSLGHAVGATDQTVSLWERNRQKIPHASEAVLRQLALEMADGNHKIAEIIERINTVERLVNQKIVATEARHKWKAEITKGEVVPA